MLATGAMSRIKLPRLYVDPPAHAIVLSLDEKSQIQADLCRATGWSP